MNDCLFAYGTLLAPELLAAVLGIAAPIGGPATLRNYACYRVRRTAYPAIVQRKESDTHGQVFAGIDPGLWVRLDRYESSLYKRETVTLELANREFLEAQTYVLSNDSHARLTNESWDLEGFRCRHLKKYLDRL
ncbi:MAG: gamma-glutamylcyclotransferase (GGCT)/AIG2-like uncharacterized protein YtfP [Gammaproteobacteria bacterium]|jgi:gamma-glutamylcyclotransferase (GGCT)/AIG2-like uncharacterized protein YtfP